MRGRHAKQGQNNPEAHRPVSRRAVVAGALCAGAALIGAVGTRIAQVNANALVIPEVVYHMGDTVSLEGAFVGSPVDERTKGYSIRVDAAEVISPNEYASRYGKDPSARLGSPCDDNPCVLDLTMTFTNDGNTDETSGILGYLWHAVDETRNFDYQLDQFILELSHPELNGSTKFRIAPDTSYTAHTPFAGQVTGPYFQGFEDTYYADITSRSFDLIVSNLPEKRIIHITLD